MSVKEPARPSADEPLEPLAAEAMRIIVDALIERRKELVRERQELARERRELIQERQHLVREREGILTDGGQP